MPDLSTFQGTQNIIANLAAVFLQQQMKQSGSAAFAWITERTPWVNRVVSAALAALTAAGVSYSYLGGGELHITGLTPDSAVRFLMAVGGNYVVQWFLYKVQKQQ